MHKVSLVRKDQLLLSRSPLNWVVLAVLSFVLFWLFWQMLDRYIALQANLIQLPNPPSITTALYHPFLLTLAKFMLLLLAMSSAQVVASERSADTMWYLQMNQHSMLSATWAKFQAQWPLLLFLWLLLGLATVLLSLGGEVAVWEIITAFVALGMTALWFMALGMWLSSFCTSTGAAVLLNLVVFTLVWLIGSDGVAIDYGLNWLALLSPVKHMRLLMTGVFSLSMLIYWLGGIGLFLMLCARRMRGLR